MITWISFSKRVIDATIIMTISYAFILTTCLSCVQQVCYRVLLPTHDYYMLSGFVGQGEQTFLLFRNRCRKEGIGHVPGSGDGYLPHAGLVQAALADVCMVQDGFDIREGINVVGHEGRLLKNDILSKKE